MNLILHPQGFIIQDLCEIIGGEHHRRRGDDDPARHPPGEEEEEARERAGPGVEAALEELVRGYRDLKARLDRIESRTSGDFHAYNSFEAVSRKLAEFETLRDDARRMERTLTLKAWLLVAAVGASALVIVIANALAH